MTEQYTPTTAEILYAWAVWRGSIIESKDWFPSTVEVREVLGAEFDRWLAARDAEIAAKALEEAASALREYGWGNPARMIYARAAEYRKEVQGD